jgi:hypothetical protein
MPILPRICDAVLALDVRDDEQHGDARYDLFYTFDERGDAGACFDAENEAWQSTPTAGTPTSRLAQLGDLASSEKSIDWLWPAAVHCYWIGYGPDGVPFCVQMSSESPYIAHFHEDAPLVAENMIGGSLSCWARISGSFPPAGAQVRGTIRCEPCNTEYIRVWAEPVFDAQGCNDAIVSIDALVDEEFVLGKDHFQPTLSPGLYDIHAAEVLGLHSGFLGNVAVEQGMQEITIVLE